MALFSFDTSPHNPEWGLIWKNHLSRFRDKIVEFLQNPQFTSVTVDDTLTAEDVHVTDDLTVDDTFTLAGTEVHLPVRGSPIATTSGTSVDISTTIPSWVGKIYLSFNEVSTNGTDHVIIQIGDSGGFETSTYNGSCSLLVNAGAVDVAADTTGFIVNTANAAGLRTGVVELLLTDASTNTWQATGNFNRGDAIRALSMSGKKSLSATLDRIRITTTGGANTFDGGSVTLRYEY